MLLLFPDNHQIILSSKGNTIDAIMKKTELSQQAVNKWCTFFLTYIAFIGLQSMNNLRQRPG